MDYVGVKTYRPDGSAQGRDSLRRASSPPRPTCARRARSRSCATRSTAVIAASGYPPASHDGKALLNILDTFPRDELFQIGVEQLQEWSEGILDLEIRPRVRVFARVDRFDRFVSVLRLCAARPLQHQGARAHRRPAGADLQRPHRRVLSLLPRRPAGAGAVHRRPLRGRDAARRRSAELERRIAGDRAHLGGPAGRCHRRQRRPRPRRCSPSTARAFSAGYAETFPPERALRGHRAHRAARGRTSRSSSTSIATPAHQPAASTPPSIRWARRSASPSACRCWRTWASRPSTSAPTRSARALPTASAR